MRKKLNQAFAFLCSAFLLLIPVNSSAAEFYKVEVVILNADGIPSSGQRISSSFDNQMRTTSESGSITFELPAGTHTFSANFFPDSAAVNLGVATTNFGVAVSGDLRIEIQLPRVIEHTLKLQDSQGRSVAHVPQNLVQLGCSWSYIGVTGLTKPIKLLFTAPKFIASRSNWSGYSTTGLMAQDGEAKFAVFQFDRPSDCQVEDLGKDGLLDFQIKTASYLDWQIIDSTSLAKGNVVIIAPDAPTFSFKFPMTVIDNRGYNQTIKVLGQLSAAHPTILTMHGKVSSPRNGNGTFTMDTNGNFTLDVYVNTFTNAAGIPFNLQTAASYQSQLLSSPPRVTYMWSGQTLTISAAGLTKSMGTTTIKYGKKVIRVSASEDGTAIAKLKSVEPAGSATYTNSLFNVKALLKSSWPSCKLLWQDFPGGIALNATAKNKGKSTTYKYTVWPAAYKFNTNLDTDKDNIACER